jgi:benzylsuccinate CoA-transferase BbsF subunit
MLPLDGVRVIDFTWFGAGPYTTRVLADHGAQVIRVESEKRLDRLRILPPFPDGERRDSVNRSGYFADRNSNKLSVTINLKHRDAAATILRLIAQSDIVASNFTPGTLAGLGLGYEQARAVKPDIIFLEMGMQGSYGPDARLVGYGQTVSALTGLYHLSGLPGQVPVGTGTNYPDHVPAPTHGAFALLAALRHQRRTGRGQYIDLSQAETMISLLGPTMLDYAVNDNVQMPQGNQVDNAVPNGVYPTTGDDRWIAISVVTDDHWVALLAELGLSELAGDSRFTDTTARRAHADDLDAAIAGVTARRERYELMTALQGRGVPVGVVQTYADLLEHDPQLRARGQFVRLPHPEMGNTVYDRPPFELGGVDEPVMRTAAPLLGEHTRAICQSLLGLDDAAIDALVEDGLLV